MAEQKERARKAAVSKIDDWVVLSAESGSRFIGYDTLECDVKISKYRRVENKKGVFYQLVFPMTPFYAESGGQVGDTGLSGGRNWPTYRDTRHDKGKQSVPSYNQKIA